MQIKILLVLFSICIIATTVDAQIKKGTVLLGGQIGFSLQKTKNDPAPPNPYPPDFKSTNITLSPAFGKAIKDNLVIGADIYYSYLKYQSYQPQQQKNNAYGAGLFVRKYNDLGKGFYFFVQGRAGVTYNRQETEDLLAPVNNTLSKGYEIQIAVYPGIAYNVSKKLQMEAGFNNLGYLQFNHSKSTALPASSWSAVTNNFSAGSSLSNFSGLTPGFRILLM